MKTYFFNKHLKNINFIFASLKFNTMFNTIKSLFLGMLCLAFISSCKKDMVNEDNAVKETSTDKSSIASTAKGSYYPYNDGVAYTYVDSTMGGESNITRSAIAISGDTTIDGKTFSKAAAAGSSNFNYYNSTEGVTTLVSFNGEEKQTTTVLKANEPVGTVWKDVFTNKGIPTTYEWKIAGKGLTRTVHGVTYADVIQVHLLGTAEVPAQGKVVFANSDYYYAPNVGLIENINYNSSTGKAELHRVLQKSAVQ
jgi:hypothetical protein